MGNVQISQELFMQLLRFHLVEDESCEKEIKQGLEKKWTGWSCVTCMENSRLLRQRKNGNGREKSIWTDEECRRVFDGNSSLVIRTGAWHAPVDIDTEKSGKENHAMREGRLGYNCENGRYGLLSMDLWIDTGFHCGECMEVLVDNQWVRTRMEMNPAREWYLVGTPYCGDLEYVIGQEYRNKSDRKVKNRFAVRDKK